MSELPVPRGQRPASPFRTGAILAAILIVGSPALVAGCFGSGFYEYDDAKILLQNPIARQGLTGDALEKVLRPPLGGYRGFDVQYMPLTNLGNGLQLLVLGERAWAFRLGNLLLHLASAMFLYGILLALLPKTGGPDYKSGFALLDMRPSTRPDLAAALAAAFFFFHPTNLESICWAVERKNAQALFFCLLAWWILLDPLSGRARARPSRGRFALAWLAFVFALGSKPTAIGWAPFFLLLEWCWYRGTLGSSALRSLALALPAALAAHIGLEAGASVLQPITGGSYAGWLATCVYQWARYADLALAPLDLSFFYGVRAVSDLADPRLYASLAALSGLLLLLWWLPVPRRALGILFAGALLAFGPLMPPRSLPYLLQDRFLYAALPFVAALLAFGLESLHYRASLLRGRRLPLLGGALAATAVAAAAALSFERSYVYENEDALFLDALEKQPQCAYPHFYCGLHALNDGRKLLAADPEAARALLLQADRHFQQAEEAIDAARMAAPLRTRFLHAAAEFHLGLLDTAEEKARWVANHADENRSILKGESFALLADIERQRHAKSQDPAHLIAMRAFLMSALDARPDRAEWRMRLARVFEELKHPDEARAEYEKLRGDSNFGAEAAEALKRLDAAPTPEPDAAQP
ncbi:MAG: hypothetical protein KIS92_22500 [Planctomycetota bacterium]|nr:hypothetical protein [Planctomycetota bacterium]